MSLGEPVEVNGIGVAVLGDLAFKQATRVDLHLADDEDRLAGLGSRRINSQAFPLKLADEQIAKAPDPCVP